MALSKIRADEVAPEGATIKRFEDNNATISAYLSGQVDPIASGNVVMAAIIAKNLESAAEMKFLSRTRRATSV